MRILIENRYYDSNNIGGVPIAFIAEYSTDNPISCILGEFDAFA
jgi:hypothetical protein